MKAVRGIWSETRSQSGASLPLALLLFLICALLASVVLSASTAVGGRHTPIIVSGQSYNQLAVSDQAYYSVASATGLFQKEFAKTPVVITCEQDKTVTTTSTNGPGGSTITGDPVEQVTGFVVKVDGKQVFSGTGVGTLSPTGLSVIELSAANVLFGGMSVNPSAPWTGDLPTIASPVNVGTFDVSCSVDAGGTDIDVAAASSALTVKVQEKLLVDGRLQARFDSAGPGQSSGTQLNAASYSLTLYIDADVDVDEQTEEGATEVSATGTARTETKTVKTTRTATITWATSEMVRTAGGSA